MVVVSSEIVVDAPIEEVWKILSDFDHYPDWNPFNVRIATSLEPGSTITMHVDMNLDKKHLMIQKETLTECKPYRMCWVTRVLAGMAFRTERIQNLTEERTETKQTRYSNTLEIKGTLVPLIMMLYKTRLQAGFDAVAVALKERCQSKT